MSGPAHVAELLKRLRFRLLARCEECGAELGLVELEPDADLLKPVTSALVGVVIDFELKAHREKCPGRAAAS